MKLGELIRIYARFHKISDRQLAKEIGLSHATVSRLLNGKTTDIKTAVRLFNWLILTDDNNFDNLEDKMSLKKQSKIGYMGTSGTEMSDHDY